MPGEPGKRERLVTKKPKPRRERRADDDGNPGDGLIARVIDRTFENPATSGGLLVMALTLTAIVSNALFLQGGQHPGSLFGSGRTVGQQEERGAVANPPMPRLAPRQRAQIVPDQVAAPPAALPVPTLTAAPDTTSSVSPSDLPAAENLVTEIQRELARTGLYRGAIDGVSGSRTEAAIREFETAAGIAGTGTPTPELLAALRQPLPPRETQSIAAAASTEAAELNRREQERARLIAEDRQRQEEIKLREAYAVVQTALNRIGYGPIAIDGTASEETAEAIRRFELDNGMPITGKAGDNLIARLFAIGAIKPG
jgi:peptidoglycan hydrolase-like protein with peptidoglycan-binding domain